MTFERWFTKKFGVDLEYWCISDTNVTTYNAFSRNDAGATMGFTALSTGWISEMRKLYNDRQKLRSKR